MSGNTKSRNLVKLLQSSLLFIITLSVIVLIRTSDVHAVSYNWMSTGNGNWNNSSDWSPNAYPNSSSDNANFPDNFSSPNINVNGTYSVNNLTFNNNNSMYYLYGTGLLNLYGSISVTGQINPTFNVPMDLENIIALNIGGAGVVFETSSSFTGSGGFTLNDGGQAYFVGTANYSGTTTINNGAFTSGANNAFSPNSDFVVANNSDAILDTGGANDVIDSLTGGAASFVYLEGGNLTTGDSLNTTYAGTIENFGLAGEALQSRVAEYLHYQVRVLIMAQHK